MTPHPYTVTVTYNPLAHPMDNDEDDCPMTRQFFDNKQDARQFYNFQVDLLDTGTVQLWEGDREILAEVA